MEIPSKSRTRVVVLATFEDKVLVRRDTINSLWSVPDSHLHWPFIFFNEFAIKVCIFCRKFKDKSKSKIFRNGCYINDNSEYFKSAILF